MLSFNPRKSCYYKRESCALNVAELFCFFKTTSGEGIGCCRGWLWTVNPSPVSWLTKTAKAHKQREDCWLQMVVSGPGEKALTILFSHCYSVSEDPSIHFSFCDSQRCRRAEWAEKDKPLPQQYSATKEWRGQRGLVLLKSSNKIQLCCVG